MISNLKADGVIATGLTDEMNPCEADCLFRDWIRVDAARKGEVMLQVPEVRGRHLEYGVARNADGNTLVCIPLEELLPEDVDAVLVRTYDQFDKRPRRYFVPNTPLVEEMLVEPPVYLGL